MSEQLEHIVIGAGISGLGMAHGAARRGVRTLVLETCERVGGCMNSRTFPDCGDFWTEAGSHTCFNSYGHLLDILADLGLTDRLLRKEKLRYCLWRGGERRSILSALHPLEMALSLPRLFTAPKTGRSVADYYGGGLGRRNYKEVFGPAFRAVICQDAADFPADLLFRRKPRRKEVVRSFTLPGGLSTIPRAIAEQAGLEVRTGQRVAAVTRDGDGFRIGTADGAVLRTRHLTLAVPPDAVPQLLPEGLEDLATAIGGIGMAHVDTLALSVPVEHLAHLPPLAGLIAVDGAFYSMVSRDYLADDRFRGFAFHFRRGALDPEAQEASACEALGIRRVQIAGLARATSRLPALRAGHGELVRQIDRELTGGRLAMTGNWFLGVSIEDCLARSHQELERLFGA